MKQKRSKRGDSISWGIDNILHLSATNKVADLFALTQEVTVMKFIAILLVVGMIGLLIINGTAIHSIKATNDGVARLVVLQSQAPLEIKQAVLDGSLSVKEALEKTNAELSGNLQALSGKMDKGFAGNSREFANLKEVTQDIISAQNEAREQLSVLDQLVLEIRQSVAANQEALGQLNQTADYIAGTGQEIKMANKEMARQFNQFSVRQEEQFNALYERTRTKILGIVPVGSRRPGR